jgi:uncharacterized protein
MSLSFNLYQLQKIDTKIEQINLRVSAIERAIADQSLVDSQRKNVQEAENLQDELFKSISDLDEEITKKKIKVNQSEAAMYGGKVQNPKELQSLQAEVASITKNILEKETIQTGLVQDFEKAEKDLDTAKSLLEKIIGEKQEGDSELKLELQKLQKEKENLESERQVAITQVQPDHLNIYEDIRRKRKNLAVSIVEDETCSGCGVNLTPSEFQMARSSNKLVFCPSCSRILYAG